MIMISSEEFKLNALDWIGLQRVGVGVRLQLCTKLTKFGCVN